MPEIRFTARGLIPSLALIGGILLVPQMLAGSLSEKQAEQLVTAHYTHVATASILDRLDGAGRAMRPEAARRLGAEFMKARNIKLSSLRVRRSLVVPPFAKRTSFYVEARRTGSNEPDYFKVESGTVYRSSETAWKLRL